MPSTPTATTSGFRPAPAERTPLALVDAWWRAANHLSVAQIYLLRNALLERPLAHDDVKPRLLGHWGTIPALNLVYAHLNRAIVDRGVEAVYVCGPGHGGQALISNAWLEGTYTDLFPAIARDADGADRLAKQFSFPGGVPSHAAPETPGSINEGGELGYSLAHAFGVAFDDPDAVVACVIGDGEAETGTLAASWHLNKVLDPRHDGAVLPILNLNGWKIANPTLLARIPQHELVSLLEGYGWAPIFVEVDDPDAVEAAHEHLAAAIDESLDRIAEIRAAARGDDGGGTSGDELFDEDGRPRWPAIVLRTPKGWTGPREVDGEPVEGTWRSHQVPLEGPRDDAAQLSQLEAWMRSYRGDELFDDAGRPVDALSALIPPAGHRMSDTARANGGVRRTLTLPAVDAHAAAPGDASATGTLGPWLAEVIRENPDDFRLFGPDEVASNKLDAVFDATDRVFAGRRSPLDEHQARSGRVVELLNEQLLQGLLEGYLLSGRHGLFTSYEAFIHIVDSMFNQHAKWLESAKEVAWRRPVASLTYLLSSHVWRQDHNGFSHQDPGFLDVVANKQAELTRIYLPADANTLLATAEHCLGTRDRVNVIVAGKHPTPVWLSLDEAREHLAIGMGVWEWAGSGDVGADPDVVLACAGDVPTMETVAAAQLLREAVPDLRIRVVNVVDLMRLQDADRHPHGSTADDFARVFTDDRPVVFAFHGYPSLVHQLTYRRPSPARFHVHGFQERGTTTTPFDMVSLNDLDRYALASAALRHAGLDESHAELLTAWQRTRDEARAFAYEHGVDPPEIEQWEFPRR